MVEVGVSFCFSLKPPLTVLPCYYIDTLKMNSKLSSQDYTRGYEIAPAACSTERIVQVVWEINGVLVCLYTHN